MSDLTDIEHAQLGVIAELRAENARLERWIERLTYDLEVALAEKFDAEQKVERRSSLITDEVVLAAWRGFSAMMCDDGEARVATYSELRAMRAALEAVWPV